MTYFEQIQMLFDELQAITCEKYIIDNKKPDMWCAFMECTDVFCEQIRRNDLKKIFRLFWDNSVRHKIKKHNNCDKVHCKIERQRMRCFSKKFFFKKKIENSWTYHIKKKNFFIILDYIFYKYFTCSSDIGYIPYYQRQKEQRDEDLLIYNNNENNIVHDDDESAIKTLVSISSSHGDNIQITNETIDQSNLEHTSFDYSYDVDDDAFFSSNDTQQNDVSESETEIVDQSDEHFNDFSLLYQACDDDIIIEPEKEKIILRHKTVRCVVFKKCILK